jgi:hypothetical protein
VLGALHKVSSIERQRLCRLAPTGELVDVEKRLDVASYSGLQTCGRRLCPCCGPRIAVNDAADIAAAITAHVANGGQVALITYTLRHGRSDALAGLLAGLGAALKAMRHDTVAKRLQRSYVLGTIVRLDVTVGANGWHPHRHALAFLRGGVTAAQLGALVDAQYRAYASSLEAGGHGQIDRKHGVHVRLLDLAAAHEQVADYVAKTAAFELASAGTKRGRGENRTLPELAVDVAELGLAEDVGRWLEVEQATRRYHWLRWSPGLRGALIPELVELTDEQAARDNDGAARLIAQLTASTWSRLRRRVNPATLLSWAEVFEDDDLARWYVNRQLAARDIGALHCE